MTLNIDFNLGYINNKKKYGIIVPHTIIPYFFFAIYTP